MENEIIKLLEEQFENMLYDEDGLGYDIAEVYNVIQTKNIERAKEILNQLGVEY